MFVANFRCHQKWPKWSYRVIDFLINPVGTIGTSGISGYCAALLAQDTITIPSLSMTFDKGTLKKLSHEEHFDTVKYIGTKSWVFGAGAAATALAIYFKVSESVTGKVASFVEEQCNNFVEKWSVQPSVKIKDHLPE